VATKEAEGECSANDESCAADNGHIEVEEELTECKDTNEECEHWASLGECDANPNYMQGKLAAEESLLQRICFLHRPLTYGRPT